MFISGFGVRFLGGFGREGFGELRVVRGGVEFLFGREERVYICEEVGEIRIFVVL